MFGFPQMFPSSIEKHNLAKKHTFYMVYAIGPVGIITACLIDCKFLKSPFSVLLVFTSASTSNHVVSHYVTTTPWSIARTRS